MSATATTDTREGTPGPWTVRGPNRNLIYAPDGWIADVKAGQNGSRGPTVETNAELIVRCVNAYDDMLAALKAAEPFLVKLASHQPTTPSRTKARNDAAAALRDVRAALAKAEGR